MNKILLKKVNRICKQTRPVIEKIATRVHFSTSKLDCLCGVASGFLFLNLTKNNIPAVIAENDEHAFILVENHIVDITASQFGEDDVCIFESDGQAESYWRIYKIYNNLSKFILSQRSWPKEQRFVKYKKFTREFEE